MFAYIGILSYIGHATLRSMFLMDRLPKLRILASRLSATVIASIFETGASSERNARSDKAARISQTQTLAVEYLRKVWQTVRAGLLPT